MRPSSPQFRQRPRRAQTFLGVRSTTCALTDASRAHQSIALLQIVVSPDFDRYRLSRPEQFDHSR
jgi:hypothetical protein